MKLRFALRVFTERILDYVLSCRCQVVGNSEFFGGVMLSTILPAWLTIILIWDWRRVLSSSMRRDRAELPPAMLAGAHHWRHGSRIVDLPISACLLELPCQKRVISNGPERLYDFGCCQGGM
jgi:hypothetical protein